MTPSLRFGGPLPPPTMQSDEALRRSAQRGGFETLPGVLRMLAPEGARSQSLAWPFLLRYPLGALLWTCVWPAGTAGLGARTRWERRGHVAGQEPSSRECRVVLGPDACSGQAQRAVWPAVIFSLLVTHSRAQVLEKSIL